MLGRHLLFSTFTRIKSAVWLSCIVVVPSLAQSSEPDSIRVLKPVEITDTRWELFSSADKITAIYPQVVHAVESSNLSQLLMKYSTINVRSYGISGLSTASLRGSGGNHTPVFWEGINLQSSMNGSLDLTLLPAFFVDEVSLQHGSLGAVYGAGTLGGAIHLSSSAAPAPGVSGRLFQQFGSFGERQTGIDLQYSQPKNALRLRAFHHRANNDFPYYNIYRVRNERRKHAGLNQRGVLAEFYQKISPRQQFAIKYWLQDNYVEIPGTAAAGSANQGIQTDLFHRMVAKWDLRGANYQLKARTAILGHKLVYQDNIVENSLNESISWISELDGTFYLDEDQWLLVGGNYTYEQAEVDSYGALQARRRRTALFASYRTQLHQRLVVTLGLRETRIDSTWSPILPSLSLEYEASNHWRLRAKVARSYNLPTFNDLLWRAGGQGNLNLLPESGWGADLGIEAKPYTYYRWEFDGSLTAFSNWFNNWLQWVPQFGSRWTPINVQRVWARGLEVTLEVQYQIDQDITLQLWGFYSYTRSTKEEINAGGNPAELHQQLIYTPYHQGKVSSQVNLKRWEVGLVANNIGEQFTDASNKQILPSYTTIDWTLSHQWPISDHHQLSVSGALNNLFDHPYEVRQGYPMPGRNYQIRVIYQFNQTIL